VSRTKKWHLMCHHASQSACRRFGVRRREAVLCDFTPHPSERLHMGSPLHRERASKDSLPGLQAVPGAQRAGSTSGDIKKLKCIAKDGYCGPNTPSRITHHGWRAEVYKVLGCLAMDGLHSIEIKQTSVVQCTLAVGRTPGQEVWAGLEIQQCSPGMAGTMPVSSSSYPVNIRNWPNNPP
jgi:hypothetical protein